MIFLINQSFLCNNILYKCKKMENSENKNKIANPLKDGFTHPFEGEEHLGTIIF